jgi:uncharacterized iron-regulated membrane protein
MSASPSARLRRLWLDIHLWIGAGLLVLLIPISLSGAVLVWHGAIDRALHAERYAVTGPAAALPAPAYAEAAQAAFADRARLTQLRLPQKPGDPVVAVGRLDAPPAPNGRPRTLNAWIDPPTGRVLATGEVARQPTMVLHRLHGSLMVPGVGRKIVGWMGWAMFVSCATGLWLWWPRNGAFLKGLRWRRGGSQLFNLHHTVGFWVCLPLAVLSLTGVYISFPQTSRALFGVGEPPKPAARAPKAPDPRFAPPLEAPRQSLEQAIAAALALDPGAALVSVGVPQQGKEPVWRIEVKAAGAERPTPVQIVDATGRPQPSKAGAQPSGGDRISPLMRKIHDGADTPMVWRVIIFLAGAAPAVLGVTGVIMWLRRRGRRRAALASAAA